MPKSLHPLLSIFLSSLTLLESKQVKIGIATMDRTDSAIGLQNCKNDMFLTQGRFRGRAEHAEHAEEIEFTR